MDKQNFFDNLHAELEHKYNVPPHCVRSIRSFSIGSKLSREEIMDWADEKIKTARKKNMIPRQRWLALFSFLETLSDEAWQDITQETQYD